MFEAEGPTTCTRCAHRYCKLCRTQMCVNIKAEAPIVTCEWYPYVRLTSEKIRLSNFEYSLIALVLMVLAPPVCVLLWGIAAFYLFGCCFYYAFLLDNNSAELDD